jgi:hypothetical protein
MGCASFETLCRLVAAVEVVMRTLALFAAASLVSLAAWAAPPEISVRLRSAPRRALAAAPKQPTCPASALARVGWVDPSDGLAIATHPTARLDEQELHSLTLASLVQLRVNWGGLSPGPSLFVVGTPWQKGQQLTQAGWLPRWPFC